jgi:hypothetical protein
MSTLSDAKIKNTAGPVTESTISGTGAAKEVNADAIPQLSVDRPSVIQVFHKCGKKRLPDSDQRAAAVDKGTDHEREIGLAVLADITNAPVGAHDERSCPTCANECEHEARSTLDKDNIGSVSTSQMVKGTGD